MIKEIKYISLSLVLCTLLSACGSSETKTEKIPSAKKTASTNKIVGRVTDGYIKNATVFFDLNRDETYTEGEPKTKSNEYGQYTLTLSQEEYSKIDRTHSIIALGDGIDVDTGELFPTKLMVTPEKKDMESLVFISPLSTFRTKMALNIINGEIAGIGIIGFQEKLNKLFDLDVEVSKQINYIKEHNVPYYRINNILQKAVEISGLSYDEFTKLFEKDMTFDELLDKLPNSDSIKDMKEFYNSVKQTHMNEKRISISIEINKKLKNKEYNFSDIDIANLPEDEKFIDVEDEIAVILVKDTQKKSGTLFSKYKNDATIFLDLNKNFVLDINEPKTLTDKNGKFIIEIDSAHMDLRRSLLAIDGKNAKNEVSKDILFATLRNIEEDVYINTFSSYQTATVFAILEALNNELELGAGGLFLKGIEASLEIDPDSHKIDDSNNKLSLKINSYVRAIANTYMGEDTAQLKIFKAYKYFSANTVSHESDASKFGFNNLVARFTKKNPLTNDAGETFASLLEKISIEIDKGNSVEDLIKKAIEFRPKVNKSVSIEYNFSNETKLPKDQFSKYQWHLKDQGAVINAKGISSLGGHDLGVDTLYEQGIVGKGVHVRVVDDGVEAGHEDLKGRMDLANSFNSEKKVNDPTSTKIEDTHGTQVAGLIAADGSNNIGLRGVAPYATLSAYKLQTPGGGSLDYTFEELGDAWLGGSDEVSIVNNSWGSAADKYQEEEKYLKKGAESMRKRIINGEEKALGRIYLLAAGNGGFNNENGVKGVDDSVTSYFRSSQYAITVAAVRNENIVTQYSAQGSNVIVSSYGGGIFPRSSALLTTTTVTGTSENTWKEDTKKAYSFAFNGTSAATPVASGALALVMQECPNLSYRDVKWLIAHTAIKIDEDYDGKSKAVSNVPSFKTSPDKDLYQGFGYIENAAGLSHSNYYGYGLLNPVEMIEKCKNNFISLPAKKTIKVVNTNVGLINIIDNNHRLKEKIRINKSDIKSHNKLDKIEWVGLTVYGKIDNLKKLSIILISPSGTKSRILTNSKSAADEILELENGYRFSSVAFVDEDPYGEWTLLVQSDDEEARGKFTKLELEVVGYKNEERK